MFTDEHFRAGEYGINLITPRLVEFIIIIPDKYDFLRSQPERSQPEWGNTGQFHRVLFGRAHLVLHLQGSDQYEVLLPQPECN